MASFFQVTLTIHERFLSCWNSFYETRQAEPKTVTVIMTLSLCQTATAYRLPPLRPLTTLAIDLTQPATVYQTHATPPPSPSTISIHKERTSFLENLPPFRASAIATDGFMFPHVSVRVRCTAWHHCSWRGLWDWLVNADVIGEPSADW